MISSEDYDWIKHSSYGDLVRRTKGKQFDFPYSIVDEEFVKKTLSVINSNPFNLESVKLLLEEDWSYEGEYSAWSMCDLKNKSFKLREDLFSFGKIYDFYERDLHLMHELNHAWFSRFRVFGQECLSDRAGSHHEFENRLINESYSRFNRKNPLMLREVVEAFGLEPQIYDKTSFEAFKDNPLAKKSKLAEESPSLLEKTFIDGIDEHYYKRVLRKSLIDNPGEFWDNLENASGILEKRTIGFLRDVGLISESPVGNYAFLGNGGYLNEDAYGLDPCFWSKGGYFLRREKDALRLKDHLEKKEKKEKKLVRISEISQGKL